MSDFEQWKKYQDQLQEQARIQAMAEGGQPSLPDLRESSRHSAEAIMAGAVVGRLLTPRSSGDDGEPVKPASWTSPLMIVCLSFLGLVTLFIIFSFIH